MDLPPPKNPPSRAALITIGTIVFVAVAVRLYLAWSTHSTAEDFYITLRYAENLAHGRGLVYNPGERVLGTTTPLYTLYLALTAWLGLDATTWGKLANIAADGVGCWLVWRLGRAVGRPGAGLIAAALFALSPPNLTWAISGMETSLVTACTLGLFVATAERRLKLVAVLAAVLYMLRVDGLLAVTAAYGALFWSGRRHEDLSKVARSAGLFLALCAPWTLTAWAYYGTPLPTSALAKLTVYAWMSKGRFPNLQPFSDQMFRGFTHWMLALFAGQGLIGSSIIHRRVRPANLWLVLYFAGMALSKGFLFGWYYVPPTGIYFFLAGLGVEAFLWSVQIIIVGGSDKVGRATNAVTETNEADTRESLRHAFLDVTTAKLTISAVVLLLGLASISKVRAQIASDQDIENRWRKPIGLALKEIVKPGERVMLEPIGYIGYFSGARVLDAVGLVSPEVIPYYRKGAVSPYLDILHDLKPEWVLLRAGEYQDALSAPVDPDRRINTHYRLYHPFPDPAAPPGSEPGFLLFRRLNHG